MNEDKLNEFLGKFVTDLGATVAAGNVVIGHRLGLYRALARGPATPGQFAERTGTTPRYIAEWLRGQAAGGYITWDAAQDRYSLTEDTNEDTAPAITCPSYVTDNETDTISAGQGKVLFDRLTCPKEFRLFTKAEGAEGHCEGMAPIIFWTAAFDWLDHLLA